MCRCYEDQFVRGTAYVTFERGQTLKIKMSHTPWTNFSVFFFCLLKSYKNDMSSICHQVSLKISHQSMSHLYGNLVPFSDLLANLLCCQVELNYKQLFPLCECLTYFLTLCFCLIEIILAKPGMKLR